MKWALATILAVALASILIAALFLDGPSTAFFSFAVVLVILLGSAPILLGAWTRSLAHRRTRQPRPHTIRDFGPESGEPIPADQTANRRARARLHRRSKSQ